MVCADQCDGLLGRLAWRPFECALCVQALSERRVPCMGRVRGRNMGSRAVVWFAMRCRLDISCAISIYDEHLSFFLSIQDTRRSHSYFYRCFRRDRRSGAWNNWNIQLAPWIPALASQFTKPYTTDVTAYIVSQTALFYPTSNWGLYTSNSDLVRLCGC